MRPESSPDERRKFVLEILAEKGRLSTSELSSHFGVSEDSARRDLKELASEGLIQRVHGAALPVSPASQSFASRYKIAADVKNRLAKEAASTVAPGQVVLLDGGTTNLAIASQIPWSLSFTAITKSPQTAMALSNHNNAEVIIIGGVFDKKSQMTVGASVLDSVRQIKADICFFGVHGIDAEAGLTTTSYDEAAIKRAMIQAALETIAVATTDKIGTAAAYAVGPTKLLDLLIVERGLDQTSCDAISLGGTAIKCA